MRRFVTAGLLAALISAAHSPAASALTTGIASTAFGTIGCPMCHVGGTAPDVVLSGPIAVAPGSVNDYTLTIFGTGAQLSGGLNVAAPLGTLSIGGPFAVGTQTIAGAMGLVEVTHTLAKQGDFLGVVEFSFQWTAPTAFTSVTLRGWGSSVNLDNTELGDAASLATLDVLSLGAETPTPAATPTPTATFPVCSNAAARNPALVSDPAAQACQIAIAKIGAGYLKKDLKAVRRCLAAFQAGDVLGDPIALCVGSATVAPIDGKASTAIGKAQTKAVAQLQARCPDAALAMLDACADNGGELGVCFIEEHRQRAIDAIASQYGGLVPTDDKGEQKCQKAVSGAAAGYLLQYLRASQKCLVKRNHDGVTADGVALCVGAIVGNAYIPPLDPKTATAASDAVAQLEHKLETKCNAAQLTALAGCGTDPTSALICLLCSHRTAVFDLLSNEFGGAP